MAYQQCTEVCLQSKTLPRTHLLTASRSGGLRMQTTSPVTPLMHSPPGGYRWVSPQGSLPALLSGSSPNGRMTCQEQQGKGMSV